MKSLRYFLTISLLLLVGVVDGYACFGPYFQPSGYMMFRAYDPDGNINTTDAVQENCLAWQRLTSMTMRHFTMAQVHIYTISLLDGFRRMVEILWISFCLPKPMNIYVRNAVRAGITLLCELMRE